MTTRFGVPDAVLSKAVKIHEFFKSVRPIPEGTIVFSIGTREVRNGNTVLKIRYRAKGRRMMRTLPNGKECIVWNTIEFVQPGVFTVDEILQRFMRDPRCIRPEHWAAYPDGYGVRFIPNLYHDDFDRSIVRD